MVASLCRFVGDAVDLDFHLALVELRFHRGARGTMIAEKFGIDFVHVQEVVRVRQEDRTLHHILRSGASELKNAADVLERHARLMPNVAE